MQLFDSGGVGDDRGNDGLLEWPGGSHHVAGLDSAVGGVDSEPAVALVFSDRGHLNTGTDWCVEAARIVDEVLRDVIFGGEGIGGDIELTAREPVVPRRPVGDQ